MSVPRPVEAIGATVPGRVSIRPQALQAVVAAIAADSVGVPVARVSARLADRGGVLRASLTMPANLTAEVRGATLLEQTELLRRDVVEQTAVLTARTIRGVDIELAGVFRRAVRRVS